MDLPFELFEDSAERLTQPDLFQKDYRVGIPPTPSNPVGTLLRAFPYDFDHAARWFAKRIEHFGQRFDLIRLESTVNFFRQFIVPLSSVRAVFGRFDPCLGISFGELDTWGLWDLDRYTQPYIRPPILDKLFGGDATKIKSIFLEPRDGGFAFKPIFDSELTLLGVALPPDKAALRDKHREGLLRLFSDVLLIKVGEDDYHPRLQFWLAPTLQESESYSFKDLHVHQSAFMAIHDEFVLTKQKCRWASNGRHNLRGVGGRTGALVMSDATGVDGEMCDEVLQAIGILPFRAHLEGRSSTVNFDDIRDYPYFSIAAPTKDLSCSIREVWKTKKQKRKHLWEDELFEKGAPPNEYDDRVAESMMKMYCWSESMWVMFPLDALIGGGGHMVGGKEVIDLQLVYRDERANAAISQVLEASKRK
jgi:4-alpha-glucanotransferase